MIRIRSEDRENVRVVTLAREKTNAIDLAMVEALDAELDAAENDASVGGVVLTGNDRFFCIGFDIPSLLPLDPEQMTVFYKAMNRLSLRLYTFPKPTVLALTGHAIAGGCILAVCGDYRFISEGHKLMGLNEVKLGLPVPYPADRMLVDIVGPRHAREIMESGDFYKPEKALALGLVDRVLPTGEVLPAAVDKAGTLGAMPARAYQRIKGNRVEPIAAGIREKLEEREASFLSFWCGEEARPLLEKAAKTF